MRALLLVLWLAFGQTPLEVTPEDGASVNEPRPVISVNLPAGVDPSTARLWVNKQEVSALGLMRQPTFVSYRPIDGLSGPVEVRFWARNSQGIGVDRRWKFTVAPSEGIKEIRHNGLEHMGEYDELEVQLRGKPGGQAWFEIEGLVDRVPMNEVTEGVYRGTYVVKPGDYRLRARIIGHLSANGLTSTRPAQPEVNIFANVFQVKVYSPPTGTQVDGGVLIKGRTRPNARVIAVVRVGFNENTPPPRSDKDENDGVERTTADAKGNFTIDYGPAVVLPNMQCVISIFAVDEQGERSVPTIVRYRL